MIAIAESGSSKCEWTIMNNDGHQILSIRTQGFNPYFHTAEVVLMTLKNHIEFEGYINDIEKVFFYGAGCSSESLNRIIYNGLSGFFTSADILVDHDLLAAAYSVYAGKPVISCIMGTGTNSCYFDGHDLKESQHALGFILGDEAGGAYFGKQLLTDYFYHKLPECIQEDFTKTFGLTWDDAVNKIYGNQHANVFLASFMPFIAGYREHEYVKNMIRCGFSSFIDIHVKSYEEATECEIGFVGSIAFVFRDILDEELQRNGLKLSRVIKSPIQELVNYHKQYLLGAEIQHH